MSTYRIHNLWFCLEFHGIENWLLVRALKTLQSSGKAELISLGEANDGVKFF